MKEKERKRNFRKAFKIEYLAIAVVFGSLFLSFEEDIYFNIGIHLAKKGNHTKAISFFDKTIHKNPKHDLALANRAICRKELGKNDLAMNDYNQAITLNTKNAELFNNRGNLKLSLKKFDAAIGDYNLALTIDAKYGLAYSNMGNAYWLKLDTAKACLNWNKARELGDQFCLNKIKNCKNQRN